MMKNNRFVTRRDFFRQTASGSASLIIGSSLLHSALAGQEEGDQKMARFGDVIIAPEHEGKEKHVPIIEAPEEVKVGEPFEVTVTVGKEVPHPNTIEHHIKWIQVYAKYDTTRPVVHLGTFDFGPTFAKPKITFTAMLEKSSTIYAIEYCNIHGLWDNSIKINVT